MGSRKIKVYTDNISLKYFTSKAQASPKELKWYDVIVSMDIELIHKLGKDNLVSDAVSRINEFIEEKFDDTMTLKIIVYSDDSLLIKGIRKDYEQDEDALEIKKEFAQTKTTREERRLIEVSSMRDGLIWFKKNRLYIP